MRPTLFFFNSSFVEIAFVFRKVSGTIWLNFFITSWAPIIAGATPRIEPPLTTRATIVVNKGHKFQPFSAY